MNAIPQELQAFYELADRVESHLTGASIDGAFEGIVAPGLADLAFDFDGALGVGLQTVVSGQSLDELASLALEATVDETLAEIASQMGDFQLDLGPVSIGLDGLQLDVDALVLDLDDALPGLADGIEVARMLANGELDDFVTDRLLNLNPILAQLEGLQQAFEVAAAIGDAAAAFLDDLAKSLNLPILAELADIVEAFTEVFRAAAAMIENLLNGITGFFGGLFGAFS